MMKRWTLTVLLAALMSINLCSAQEQAASSIGASDDCTDISVDFTDDPNLTREEKEIRMEQALRHSLNRYDRCHNAHAQSAAGGGGGTAGSDGGGGNSGQGTGKGTGQGASTASAEMKGTNSPVEEKTAPEQKTAKLPPSVNKTGLKKTNGKQSLGNGRVPADIPPSDNDSVLEEQIRQAAINETDPVIKEKLWNEYRRYKGLPAVNKSQGQ